MHKIGVFLINLVELYSYLLIAWILGSWFQQIRGTKIYQWIDKAVEPYARIFRSFIPPIGGFDFSVIVAYLVLALIENLIAGLLL